MHHHHPHHSRTRATYEHARRAFHHAWQWLHHAHSRAHSSPVRQHHYRLAESAAKRAVAAFHAGRWWDVVGDSATAAHHARLATKVNG